MARGHESFYPDSGETSSNYLMGNNISFQETSFYPGIMISRKCHFVSQSGNLLSPKPGQKLPSIVGLCLFHRGNVAFSKPGYKLPTILWATFVPILRNNIALILHIYLIG